MPMACKICNHNKRIDIDRLLVQGRSYQKIGKKFNVSWQSVRNHAKNHLSRQLTQAWAKKSSIEALDLLGQLEDIITKAKKIFDRNYEKGNDGTALKALAEQRNVLDLLCRIAQMFHEASVMELSQTRDERDQEVRTRYQEALKRLSKEELRVLAYLSKRLAGDDIPDYQIPDIFKDKPNPIHRVIPTSPPKGDFKPDTKDEVEELDITHSRN